MSYLDREYQSLKAELDQAWFDTSTSGRFIGGESVKIFEEQLSNYLGASYVVSCANGTDALLAAYMALDIQKGDEIITPAFGYISAYEMARLLGAKPVLVDINEYYSINLKGLKEKISTKTKAIVIQHLFGQVGTSMKTLSEIAKDQNIKIIEDTAQAIGSTYRGELAGTIGDIGTFSFFPTKNLGCYGDGGAIICSSAQLHHRISQICKHGQSTKYYHERIGMNSRLDSLQARILSTKLNYLDLWNRKRSEIAQKYSNAFNPIKHISCPQLYTGSNHTYHQYTIRTARRDDLQNHLKARGVESTVYYPRAINEQPIHDKGDTFSNAEEMSLTSLSLPISPFLKDEEIDLVINTIQKWEKHA